MAVAFDAVSSGSSSGAGPINFSHSCASGSTLFVCVSWYHGSSTVSTVTYNSVAMTAIPSSLVSASQYNTQWYYLLSPATGSNTVSITFSGNTFENTFAAISFTGTHASTPYDAVVTATNTSTTPSVDVSSSTTEIVVDGGLITHNGTLSEGASQTSRWNAISSGGSLKFFGSTETGAATTTMSWSNSTSQLWVQSSFAVVPPADTTSHLGTLLGIGG